MWEYTCRSTFTLMPWWSVTDITFVDARYGCKGVKKKQFMTSSLSYRWWCVNCTGKGSCVWETAATKRHSGCPDCMSGDVGDGGIKSFVPDDTNDDSRNVLLVWHENDHKSLNPILYRFIEAVFFFFFAWANIESKSKHFLCFLGNVCM